MTRTSRFTGHIVGLGTRSGTRVVVGLWDETPFGRFADAMVQDASGHRTLVAPEQRVADYVASTYTFDEIVVTPVVWGAAATWTFTSDALDVAFTPGSRLAVARLLRVVPPPLRRSPTWARVCDPVASRIMPGVHTYGSAGSGRDEWYAATDVRRVTSASVRWQGDDAGALADVAPPVTFGFASAPRSPAVTALSSYVRESYVRESGAA